VKKIAILGASYLQKPLVLKAKEMGLETHVFAWRDGNVVEEICDFYYDISILDKEAILKECKIIGIDGITSIASDIAMPSVNYVAHKLGLVGNSLESTLISTDKFEMRKALTAAGVTCPKFAFFSEPNFTNDAEFTFPVIVKPTDRSGSRGVSKVYEPGKVNESIEKALANSINGRAIVEEFIVGREFSVEGISANGKHKVLTITDKVTTGEPYYVELEHHQPARIDKEQWKAIEQETLKVLYALKIENGASHTEVFLTEHGAVRVVESAGRMGGEWIGSHMVEASTGFDFLKATLKVALGQFDLKDCFGLATYPYSGVYYITPKPGKIEEIELNIEQHPDIKDYHIILGKGAEIDEILDGSGKRAAIIFYSGSKYRPFERNEQDYILFKTI
jgi:biotin carboxylase